MFEALERIYERPEPFSAYTAAELWTDEYVSARMLEYHLDPAVDIASRRVEFIDRSVNWIADRFGVCQGFRIADFGCGPGLYAVRLARRGADVTGIDFSGRSIAYARATAERERSTACFIEQDYLEFETAKRFDLVLLIYCDFCVLSPTQRAGLLRRFRRVLKPGGHVLLDVYSLPAFQRREEDARVTLYSRGGFWAPGRYYEFLNRFKYEEARVALDQYTIVEADRVRRIYNWFQHFAASDLEREFTAAGYSIEGFHSDVAGGDYAPGAVEFAVVARTGGE